MNSTPTNEWKEEEEEEEEENWTNMSQKWMLRDYLKSQGAVYLPAEDLRTYENKMERLNP